jgi:2-C-methyl-D-erythritol 4-phosphate cytidylyltransferase/2-C-methyl-D-erythritol 2,4-cyclodiphosphate synthase
MDYVALIVASGTGQRFGSPIPKQYLKLNDSSVLRQTIQKFYTHKNIDKIKVVINPNHLNLYKEAVIGLEDKLLPYSYGGDRRQDSVLNGLEELVPYNPKYVLIHDAARPFTSKEVISNVIKQLATYDAVDTGITITDTLKSKLPLMVHERDNFYLTHTPQGFNFPLILKLHQKHNAKTFTDDISLCINAGIDVGFVESNKGNIKITVKDDLKLEEKND